MNLYTAPGISASPSEENMRYFNVMILGPAQSPYEGNELINIVSMVDFIIGNICVYIYIYYGFS